MLSWQKKYKKLLRILMFMKKILLISNMISPARTLLYNTLSDISKKQWYQLRVIFSSKIESNRNFDTQKEESKFIFDYTILEDTPLKIKAKKDNHFFHLNLKMQSFLENEKPDIIIHAGWAWLSAWTSLRWCKKNNAQYILWSWSTEYERSWMRKVTKPFVKYLVRNAHRFLSYGTRSTEYLVSLWAPYDKVYPLYNTVDISYFKKNAADLISQKEDIKRRYGITTKYVLLFIGQLIERKGIYNTLYGFAEFQKKYPDISLIFAWNGQEKWHLETIIKEQNIKNVYFPWFFQVDAISEIYTIADIFTLPSIEEVWWLVINEAMCFGLPIITAKNVGASVDLVKEWANGYIMKEDSPTEFQKWLEFVFENNLIEKNTSAEIIENFTVSQIVRNLKF